MKKILGACIACGLLAGCNAPSEKSLQETSSTRFGEAARGALRAQGVGRAWDNGAKAAQNNNLEGLAQATQQLRKLGANDEATRLGGAVAENLVIRAATFDAQALLTTGATRRQLQRTAARTFRQALQIAPDFRSENPQLLNALGWFLAERGTSKTDFVVAEKLTRRALKQIENQSPVDQVFLENLFSRAVIRDSLAWALFRQGRFDEALREQQKALTEITRATRDKSDDESQRAVRELREHLAQIKAAQKSQ